MRIITCAARDCKQLAKFAEGHVSKSAQILGGLIQLPYIYIYINQINVHLAESRRTVPGPPVLLLDDIVHQIGALDVAFHELEVGLSSLDTDTRLPPKPNRTNRAGCEAQSTSEAIESSISLVRQFHNIGSWHI